jgi:hypothetical protein
LCYLVSPLLYHTRLLQDEFEGVPRFPFPFTEISGATANVGCGEHFSSETRWMVSEPSYDL